MRQMFFVVLAGLFASASHAGYVLIVGDTTAGSLGGNTSLYGGLQRWDVERSGGPVAQGTGIPSSQLADPVGVWFDEVNSKLFVSNRHGNTTGNGSIRSFDWDGTGFSGPTTIAQSVGSAFQGWHGFSFAPNGDIFTSTNSGGTRRFRDSGSGYVDIGGSPTGTVRDTWVSPDGTKLWEASTGSVIYVSTILAGSIIDRSSFVVSGASAIHQMSYRGGKMYLGGFNSSTVHEVTLDANFSPVSSTFLFNLASSLGITFSPDGNEMYVSGHTTNRISRYVIGGTGQWIPNGIISTGKNMGWISIIPGDPARITGTLDISDVTGTIHGSDLTVEVRDGSTVVETLDVVLGAGGTFELNPMETSGARTLRFICRSGLKRNVNVSLQPTPVDGLLVVMQNGDVDQSGEVDAADIDLVIAAFGSTTLDQEDVDASGEVDAADIDVVITNFGAVED